ncbi:hypothetical protein ACFL26_00190 [Patescibacteria group bacterium]
MTRLTVASGAIVAFALLTGCQHEFQSRCFAVAGRGDITVTVDILTYEEPGNDPSSCRVSVFNANAHGEPVRVQQFIRGTHGATIDLAIVRVAPGTEADFGPATREQCRTNYHIMSDEGGLLEFIPSREFRLRQTVDDCR